MAKKTLFNPPDTAEREYIRILAAYVRVIKFATNKVLNQIRISSILSNNVIKVDSLESDLMIVLEAIIDLILPSQNITIAKLPGMFAMLSKFNDREFRLVFKANTGISLPESRGMFGSGGGSVLGVDVYRSEPYLIPMRDQWIANNVSLIKSIDKQYLDKVETTVRNAVARGLAPKELAKQIQDQFGVTAKRAQLIASDQILSANAQLTQYRLQSVRVDSYIWRTSNDSRVRDTHREKEGKVFKWTDSPRPGEEIRCRCRAEGVFPEEFE